MSGSRIERARAAGPAGEVAPACDLAHEPAAPRGRVAELDALRGVAVLVMVAWHGCDGWLAAAHREGAAWAAVRVLGGLAAPLFLFASGAAADLGAARARPLSRAIERGLSLVAAGFLLELERWAVDRGAALTPAAWPAIALGAAAGAALLAGARMPRALRRRRAAVVLALALGHLACVWALDPALLGVTLRFDVLHCIGVCGVVAALLARAVPIDRARGALLLSLTALAMMVMAPHLAEALARSEALAWIARGPELRAVAPFPLLPWCAYAVLGCGLARAARLLARRAISRGALATLAVIALASAVVSFEGGLAWTRRALDVWPELRPLSRLAFHASAMTAIGCVCAGVRGARAMGALRAMGAQSLAIYVLHVPLTHGALAAPWYRALGPAECALAIGALLVACAAGAAIAARAARSRTARAGGERAHMVARDIVSSANLRA